MSEAGRREELLTLAALVRANSADEMRFRFEALKAIAGLDKAGVDRWTVLAKVEDVAGFRSDEEILGALAEMGVIEPTGDGIRLVEEFTLDEVMGETRSRSDLPYGLTLIESLEGSGQQTTSGAGLLAMIEAVRLARRRVKEMWTLISDGHDRAISGVSLPPTFWRWEDRENAETNRKILAPWGAKPSTYTVLDMHRMLVHPLLTLPLDLLGLTPNEAAQDLAFATRMLDATVGLAIGRHPPESNGVRVFFTSNDDDYPGALRPVVPSNAALLLTLALEREAFGERDAPDRTTLVADLVRFLVDQRNRDGTWGVYRFKDREMGVPAFTALTLRALTKAVQLWPDMAAAAVVTVREEPQLLGRKLAELPEGNGVRAGFFPQGRYSTTETLDLIDALASLPAGNNLFPVHLAGEFAAAARAAARAWTVVRTGSRENIYTVTFQAPYENNFAPATTTWEQPAHARTLVSLLSLARTNSPLRPFSLKQMLDSSDLSGGLTLQEKSDLWEKIDATVLSIVAAHENGCWYDFNLPDCVFPSNMIYCIDALCEYIKSFITIPASSPRRA